jgi:hypothetical protein
LEQEKSTNKSSPKLSIGAIAGSVLLTEENAFDGNFPSH